MSTQSEKNDKPGKRFLDEILREAWLDALGTLERTETELLRLGERLREAFIGDESTATALMSRIRQRRVELERRVDDGVRHALAMMADPLRREIAGLRERLDLLTARLDEQAQKRSRRRHEAGAMERDDKESDGKTPPASSEVRVDSRSDGMAR
jgi:hypothetical protein